MRRVSHVLHGPEVAGAGGVFCLLQEACRGGARVHSEGNGGAGLLFEPLEHLGVGHRKVCWRCDVLCLYSPCLCGRRSRSVVGLWMVRTRFLWRLLCWATLRSPFPAAAWCATCLVCRAAMHSALPAWVAVVAMAPLARMRSVRLPSAATSSTRRAQLAFGGCFPWAGRRVETTCTWVVFGATGGVGGAAVSRSRHRLALRVLAIPVAIQCPWKTDHGLFFFCFPFGCLGRCCEACLALSCS